MTELWLNFTDENGEARRILADGEKFTVGRHSENDLSVRNGKLSREHVKIERFGDVFVISDCNSSNGTTINDENLNEPRSLENGDKLNLGGGLEIEIEIVSDDSNAANPAENEDEENSENNSQAAAVSNSQNISASSGGSIPTAFFYLAPIFGLVVLLLAVGLFFAFRDDRPEIVSGNNSFIYSNEEINSSQNTGKNNSTPNETPRANSEISNKTPESNSLPTPQISGEAEKVKQSAALFLQRVAGNDPNAFLTNKQAEILTPKINQIKTSSALAENLKSAKKDSARVAEIARGKGLKPEFLLTAALAKIGNARGDVAETAEKMANILNNLSLQIGNESASDCPLILAAYEQGEAGDFMKMRNMLQALANQFPNASSNTIRSIWFLKENGKISESQFELALRFLAIGTIMQNPKDFGVDAEPISF